MQLAITIIGFILFISLVIFHELGHLVAARRNGVDVEEFGLGIPPRLAAFKRPSGLLVSLNWLPIGGFVKLKGEHDSDHRPRSFGAAGILGKSKIMLAGVFVNLMIGLLILTVLAVVGMPKFINAADYGTDQFKVASDTHISRQNAMIIYVEPDSPAAKIGLKPMDSVLDVKGAGKDFVIRNSDDLRTATTSLAGQPVQVTIKRGGLEQTRSVVLRSQKEVQASLKTDNPKGYLGVEPYNLVFTRSTWSAPVFAVGFTGQLIELTAKGLWHALSGFGSYLAGLATSNHTASQNGEIAATSQVGGPIAIVKILTTGAAVGWSFMLAIIAIISLTLAFMNVLPIPALDGGRLFVMLASRAVLKRPLRPKTEELIHGAGMLVLLGLFILISIVDYNRFF